MLPPNSQIQKNSDTSDTSFFAGANPKKQPVVRRRYVVAPTFSKGGVTMELEMSSGHGTQGRRTRRQNTEANVDIAGCFLTEKLTEYIPG